jgi:hypothetical protein
VLTHTHTKCYADAGSSTRGNLLNAVVVERRNIAGKSVKARHGARAIDSGAAPRMGMKMAKTSQIIRVRLTTAAMAATAYADGSV